MKNIAIFTTKYSELIFKERMPNNPRVEGCLDFYDRSSYSRVEIETKNPAINVPITSMPFYMFFGASTKKYDRVFFLSDFPLYNGDASRFIIKQAQEKSHSVFFHPKHRQALEDLGFKIKPTACMLADDFLTITEEDVGGFFRNILNFTRNGKNNTPEEFRTIYQYIQDGTCFEEVQKQRNSFPYSYVGAYYKAYTILNVLRYYNMTDKVNNFLDLGSGSCLVAFELLFHFSRLRDVSIVCVDKGLAISEKALQMPFFESLSSQEFVSLSPEQKAHFTTRQAYLNRMRSYLPAHCRQNFQYFEQSMEKFHFPKQYDVIYLIGSLLFMPREELPVFLSKIIEHLTPGGLLCIHESIKEPSSDNSYSLNNLMFKEGELEEYLNPWGSVSYFHSVSGSYINKEALTHPTAWRVIKKDD